MTPREQAEAAPYNLVTRMEECPFDRFWVVLVSCNGVGVEVYQSEDNAIFDEPSAWMRLKKFCEDNGYVIANMAYGNKNLDVSKQINFNSAADGYYYAKRVRKLMSANPRYAHYSDNALGLGQLENEMLTIYWIFDDGNTEIEKRPLLYNSKSLEPVSLIRK